ncbi:SEC59/DGK1/VTE5 family protein [soil metagenome]
MNVTLAIGIVFLLLLINEWLWWDRPHGEASRKFVHISVGTLVALWPLLLSWKQIELLSLAFVVGVIVSRQFNIFKAIHAVERPTWGELYFGASVGLIAITTHEPAIYAVALLHMSLADGLAAVIGHAYGRKSVYRVFGARKSGVGTLTFLVVSLAILTVFSVQQGISLGIWLPLLACSAALLENIAVRGLDNLVIPLFITLMLSSVI